MQRNRRPRARGGLTLFKLASRYVARPAPDNYSRGVLRVARTKLLADLLPLAIAKSARSADATRLSVATRSAAIRKHQLLDLAPVALRGANESTRTEMGSIAVHRKLLDTNCEMAPKSAEG